jgi:hypothetical protein
MYAAMAAGWIVLLYLTVSCRVEMARTQKRSDTEIELLRESLAQANASLQEMAVEVRERAFPPSADTPDKAINLNKRWEALRMFRHGTDPHTISGALGMPVAEVALLRTVHGIMAEQLRADEVSRLEGKSAAYPSARSAQAISSKRAYSPEA